MKCLAYLRKSKKSDDRAVSLEAQQDAVQQYAAKAGLDIVGTIKDDGVSGGDNERFKRIYAMLLGHGAEAIVCYHLDRFSRDLSGMLGALETYNRAKIELHVVGRGKISVAKAMDFLMVGIEGVVAQHQRMLAGEKTKDALQHLKENGKRYSNFPPYGYFYFRGMLQEHVEEQKTLLFITGKKDWPARRLQRWLNVRHIYSRAGRPWQATTLLNIQRRINENREA